MNWGGVTVFAGLVALAFTIGSPGGWVIAGLLALLLARG